MEFDSPLVTGALVRRYKRFLADVMLDDGTQVVAHVANSGSMLGLSTPGSRVWLSPKTGGKLAFSWEIVEIFIGKEKHFAGVNTSHPNRLAEAAIAANALPELSGYTTIRREVKYGVNSRIDLLLEGEGRPRTYVEVKNVHLWRDGLTAEFPDAVTARGAKHLSELAAEVAAGNRAVMLYVVQGPATGFRLARDIDPAYGAAFDKARAAGVEAYAVSCRVSPEAITIQGPVPVLE